MPLPYTYRLLSGLSVLMAGCLLVSSLNCQAAAGDDYLRQIEAEAKQLATTPITSKAAPASSGAETTERLPLGLQQEDFERVLRNKFGGTYIFFERLTVQNKSLIYELYQQDNRVSTIREQTLRLLSESGP